VFVYALPFEPVVQSRSILGLGLPSSANCLSVIMGVQRVARKRSISFNYLNKKHLKNVGPIRHNEPPHAHSPDVASSTVARSLRIDVHDNDDNDNDNA